MVFTKELLQLHLVQAEQALYKANNNSYSDKHKQEYQQNLQKLFTAVKNDIESNATSLTDMEIYGSYKQHLDFIFNSLEFLDSSTLNQIPYEIVECLNLAMGDWLELSDKYIIVTSLVNSLNSFSYDPRIAFNEALHNDIFTKYNILFSYRLVQINLPKALSRDYLANVVLYHELGHFVERKYYVISSLVSVLYNEFESGIFDPSVASSLKTFFPYWDYLFTAPSTFKNDMRNSGNYYHFLFMNHWMEYFCDLFAAQYIGESSNYFLTYITQNQNNYGEEHPSTINRVQVVSDFVSFQKNAVIELINEALTNIKSMKLEKRYTNLTQDNFFNLIPTPVTSVSEVHGLFNVAWCIWLNDQSKFETAINKHHSISINHYKIINNLVEKSIGNYITIKRWKQAQNKLNPTI